MVGRDPLSVPSTNESGRDRSEKGLFSAGVQTAVRAELEVMFSTPIFAQSSRCKNFLDYVVLQTLLGKAGQLKERTIGISVFNRANDYDPGEDAIVRVTANEVRKRLGQFYRESKAAHPIQIELPRGAYVPEFRIQPSRRENVEDDSDLHSSDHEPIADEVQPHVEIRSSSVDGSDLTSKDESTFAPIEAPKRNGARKVIVDVALLVLLLSLGATIFGIWKIRAQKAGPQVWEAFSHSKVPVLICVDTHDLHLPNASPEDRQRFVDLVLHKQIIALDDAAIISSMAATLGKKGIPFRVVGAEQTSLSEFRRQPVILIGAIDNKWTLRLSKSLPYRIEVANPPGSGSDKEPIASILDSEHPEYAPWTVDLSTPFSTWKSDYAILARMDDPTTGVPVLMEAGLGNDGTLAASELVTSDAFVSQLKNEPLCSGKSNFEAVVGTNIIDTRPGPPHILRLKCW
jgi:hypothetical protein